MTKAICTILTRLKAGIISLAEANFEANDLCPGVTVYSADDRYYLETNNFVYRLENDGWVTELRKD